MRTRLVRTTLAFALPATLLAAGCSSSKKSSSGSSPSTSGAVVTAKTANTVKPPAGPADPTKTTFSTDSGHQYTLTVTPLGPDAKAECTSAANNGSIVVPFSLTIHNDSAAKVPQPWIGLASAPGSPQAEVPAMNIDGTCIDFTLKQNLMDPNATVTYKGSYSNASAKSTMLVRLNDAKAGTPGELTVPLFKS
jgi:hypothetical protein